MCAMHDDIIPLQRLHQHNALYKESCCPAEASPQTLLRNRAVRLQIKSQKGEKAAAIHDALGDLSEGPGQVSIPLHAP